MTRCIFKAECSTATALFYSLSFLQTSIQARSQDLEKGGGYFERVRKVQTTVTRIFIVLESVSHGLSENSAKFLGELGNSKVFSAQNQVVSKKKKFFAEIESDFLAEIRNSKLFSAQNQVVSKKNKKVFAEIESDFSAKFANSNV